MTFKSQRAKQFALGSVLHCHMSPWKATVYQESSWEGHMSQQNGMIYAARQGHIGATSQILLLCICC